MSKSTPPFSADALNRFRMTHPDRDIKALLRRLNRLPYLADQSPPKVAEGAESLDQAQELQYERELARLEVDKWRLGVERMVASAENVNRQRESYVRKTEETVARTEQLRQMLIEEKILLARRLAERDQRVKCDEVAKKIVARGKTRKELNEQLEELKQSITDHRVLYDQVLMLAQARADTFSRIPALVDECRAMKLPSEPAVDGEEALAAEVAVAEAGEVEHAPVATGSGSGLGSGPGPASSPGSGSGASAGSGTRLSAQSLPFHPSAPSASASSRSGSKSPAPVAHPLPSRPVRGTSAPVLPNSQRYRTSAGLPPRPSALRTVTSAGSLEEGEVGGDEEGEVKEGNKRKAAEDASPGRTARSRPA